MHQGMRKPRGLKVRRFMDRLIDLNKYSALFPGDIISDKIGLTKLSKILLNSMPNSWSNQSYVQGFDYESILFKKLLNMIKKMEISESIFEGAVEPSYKNLNRVDVNRAGHSRNKRGEAASSQNHSEIGESAGKCRKQYLDLPVRRIKNLSYSRPRTFFL